jgi:hypothetical protein
MDESVARPLVAGLTGSITERDEPTVGGVDEQSAVPEPEIGTTAESAVPPSHDLQRNALRIRAHTESHLAVRQ